MVHEESSSAEKRYSEEFYLQVKQVLENFYDFPYLNTHQLAHAIMVARLKPSETDGQRLRRVFQMVMGEMRPHDENESKTVLGRHYNLLNLRYIEAATMQFVAHELGISERQAYRDLKKAEESLAALIWMRVDHAKAAAVNEVPVKNADDAPAPEFHLQPTSLQELLINAGQAIKRLAMQQKSEILFELPDEPVYIMVDPVFAQQVVINLMSTTIQQAESSQVIVRLEKALQFKGQEIHFQVQNCIDWNILTASPTNGFLRQLGWKLEIDEQTDQQFCDIRVVIAQEEIILMVIDDHPSLIELLQRYLMKTRCHVVGISDANEGLRLAQALKPTLILLDIMMPDIDGWELLQRLRNSPETVDIPVVVCSIFNDPKLAYSLGASAVLPKPVRREALLKILQEFGIAC